jgi:hypothetical protein
MVELLINDSERIWKEAFLLYYPEIFGVGTTKTRKI